MQVILYVLLVFASIVVLLMLYNRLYFEIHLNRATKILNNELKKATKEQVEEFSKELEETFNAIIDNITNGYEELAEQLSKVKEK